MSKRKWTPSNTGMGYNYPNEDDSMEEDMLLPEEEEDIEEDSDLGVLIKLLKELLIECRKLSTQIQTLRS